MKRNDVKDLPDVFQSTLKIGDDGDARSATDLPQSAASSDALASLGPDICERGPVRRKDKPKSNSCPYKPASVPNAVNTNPSFPRLTISDTTHSVSTAECDNDFTNNPTFNDIFNKQDDLVTFAKNVISSNDEQNPFRDMEQDPDDEPCEPNVKLKEQHSDLNLPKVNDKTISTHVCPSSQQKKESCKLIRETLEGRPSLTGLDLKETSSNSSSSSPNQYTSSTNKLANVNFDIPTSTYPTSFTQNQPALQSQRNQQPFVRSSNPTTHGDAQHLQNNQNLFAKPSGSRTMEQVSVPILTGVPLQPPIPPYTIPFTAIPTSRTNTAVRQVNTPTLASEHLAPNVQPPCVQTSNFVPPETPVALIFNVTVLNVLMAPAAAPVTQRPLRPKESMPVQDTLSRQTALRTGPTPLRKDRKKQKAAQENVASITDLTSINSDGDSCLHLAALHKVGTYYMTALVDRILKECPYLLNMENNRGQTPLYLAVYLNLHDNVKILVEKEADPNILVTTTGVNGVVEKKAAIHVACMNTMGGSDGDHGANTGESSGATLEGPEAERAGESSRAGGSQTKRKFMHYPKTLKELLKSSKIDVDIKNSLGQTALHCAVAEAADPKNVQSTKIIQQLLEAKADLFAADTKGRTPLMYAVMEKLPGLVEILVRAAKERKGDLVLMKDCKGKTALDMALEIKDSDGIKIWNTLNEAV